MSNTRYTVTVPVNFKKDGQDRTSFRRVGVAFVNERNDGKGEILNIKLDFPVGVDELVCFPPNDNDVTED